MRRDGWAPHRKECWKPAGHNPIGISIFPLPELLEECQNCSESSFRNSLSLLLEALSSPVPLLQDTDLALSIPSSFLPLQQIWQMLYSDPTRGLPATEVVRAAHILRHKRNPSCPAFPTSFAALTSVPAQRLPIDSSLHGACLSFRGHHHRRYFGFSQPGEIARVEEYIWQGDD